MFRGGLVDVVAGRAWVQAERGPDRLGERLQRRTGSEGGTPADRHRRQPAPTQLRGEPRLPGSRLTGEQQDPRSRGSGRVADLGSDAVDRVAPSDEGAGARTPHRPGRTGLVRFEGRDRVRLAFGLPVAPRPVPDRVPRTRARALVHEHLARRREVGEPGRGVDGVADHREPRRFLGGRDHDLSGVDPREHGGELDAAPTLVELGHVIAHGDRGANGAFGVVFVRSGNAEYRHEPVAEDLRHRAP
jgi:hypothetical protein